jgi:hypothetical protein
VPGVRYNSRPVKRIARILLNALTALSLVLFVAVVAVWVRGLRRGGDAFVFARQVLDDTGYRLSVRTIEWGGGDAGLDFWTDYADAAQARERGVPPGAITHPAWRFEPASRRSVGREFASILSTSRYERRVWGGGAAGPNGRPPALLGVVVKEMDRRVPPAQLRRAPLLAARPARRGPSRVSRAGWRASVCPPARPHPGPLPHLRLRPPRLARAVPGVRDRDGREVTDVSPSLQMGSERLFRAIGDRGCHAKV